MDINIYVYALLGLGFYEALRVYKAIRLNKDVVPNSRYYAYAFTIIVFSTVSILCVELFAEKNIMAAFLFGFSIPTGANLNYIEGQSKKIVGDDPDDLWKHDANLDKDHNNRVAWISKYFLYEK